jgi:DNA primase
MLPDGEDPDSYLKKVGIEEFRKYLKEKEQDFIFFKTNLLLAGAGDDPIRKSKVLKDIVQSIAKIPDNIKKQLYIQKCSSMMGISEEILIGETNKVIRANQKQQKYQQDRNEPHRTDDTSFLNQTKQPYGTQIGQGKQVVTGDDYQEKDVLRVLISHGNQLLKPDTDILVCAFIINNVKDEIPQFDNELVKTMFSMAVEQFEASGKININDFVSSDNEQIRTLAIDFLADPYIYASWEEKGLQFQTQKEPEHNQEKDAIESIKRFLFRKQGKRIDQLEAKIKELSVTPGSELELIRYIKAHKIVQSQRTKMADELGSVFIK